MDPKRAQEIQDRIAAVANRANLIALGHYAQLLKACGVRNPKIWVLAL
jgi:hypothetical protein